MEYDFKVKFEEKFASVLSCAYIGEVAPLCDAMRYASFSGGKRLRPQCVMLGAEFALGRTLNEMEYELVLELGVCIELIHTYSLVHDDLPSMDNDDFRRGRPTVHKKFGENFAILAGDALLNLAYERLFALIKGEKLLQITQAAEIIAKNAGVLGMVKGQCLDLNSNFGSVEELLEVNRFKTGCLFKASFLSGAVSMNAKMEELEALDNYAENLGAAFQIIDDLLDLEKGENSIVKMAGEERAKKLAKEFTDRAIFALSNFEEKNSELKKFANKLFERTQ
ncbi:MAG TPA: polyprenyl synthetase family protein [Clostridia bacterium]|nr:polyprenyl synthetase family protein [Clostridia bacterium]